MRPQISTQIRLQLVLHQLAGSGRKPHIPIDKAVGHIVRNGAEANDIALVDAARKTMQRNATAHAGRAVEEHTDARTGAAIVGQKRGMDIDRAAGEVREDAFGHDLMRHRGDKHIGAEPRDFSLRFRGGQLRITEHRDAVTAHQSRD